MPRLLRTPPLVLLAVLMVLAGALATGWLVLREARLQRGVHGALLAQKMTATRNDFRLLMRPFPRILATLDAWYAAGELTATDADAFARLVGPLADPTPQVRAVYLVPDAGPALLLSRADDGWRLDRSDSLAAAPWLAAAVPGRAEWSDYAALPGDGRPGLIAVRRTGDVVFGAALLEATLDDFAAGMDLTANALLVRRLSDGTIAWLNPGQGNRLDVTTADELLVSPRAEHVAIGAALRAWGEAGRPYDAPLTFRHAGALWWCVFYPSVEGTDPGELALVVPEGDLARRLDASRGRTTAIMAVVMALALGTLAALAWTWRSRWQRVRRRAVKVPPDEAALRALVAAGESDRLEFKSTMRFNLKAGKPGKEIELAWLKSVVAYLNTDGGVVLLGVSDEGEALGLEADGFRNDDKLLLHFDNLIKQHVGLQHARLIRGELRELDGRRVFLVACGRSDEPVFLRDGEREDFYIRVGPSSRRLPPSRIAAWTREHRP